MNFIKDILSDLRVDLADEFDRNFERKGFFSQKWDPKAPSGLILTGKLRRSIRSRQTSNSLVYTSSEDYAEIHNNGGEIVVTEKMKRFFWAMAYQASGKSRTKTGKKSTGKSAQKWNQKAEIYRGLALKKVGSKIKIPKRQYIGTSPEVRATIKRIADLHVEALMQNIFKKQ